MAQVNLGLKSKEEKDSDIVVYDTVEISEVMDVDGVSPLIADSIVAAMNEKFSTNELFAVEVDLINSNLHDHTIDINLEFKGADISEEDLAALIQDVVTKIEASLPPMEIKDED
jgi:hypothetical protein